MPYAATFYRRPRPYRIALQVCVALAMAIGLERLRRVPAASFTTAARSCSRFCRLLLPCRIAGLRNPMGLRIDVGGIVINCCCWPMPCPRCWRCCCPIAVRAGVRQYATPCGRRAVLALAYVTFEIRRSIMARHLSGETTGAEQYTYSIAYWRSRGAARGRHPLHSQRARWHPRRIALTIAKAFLIDNSA